MTTNKTTTREFDWESIDELVEGLAPVEKLDWRHGHKDVYVFESEGAHWQIVIDVHSEEGWQTYGDTCAATRVVPYEKTITAYRPWKEGDPT